MGCVWDAEAPRVPVPLRVARLIAVHRALAKWVERGVKELSPPWASPRVKPPMPQCATPRRLRFAEGSPYTIPQTSHSEQPTLCVRQPQYDPPLEKRPQMARRPRDASLDLATPDLWVLRAAQLSHAFGLYDVQI